MGCSLRHAGVVCIKSTHNVPKAKRMHSCHHDTSGTLGDRLASDCDFAVYVESLPNVKLGCLSYYAGLEAVNKNCVGLTGVKFCHVSYVYLDPLACDISAGVLLQQLCLRLGEISS